MATRGVVCSYQEVVDLHTEPDNVTVIGIHTPTGDTPRRLFRGFFDQYKKYKYLGCSVSLVPAARLPADMLQVSYGAGDYIDPRDTMNPVMFHGCHGDDMGTILNRLYNASGVSDSLDAIEISQSGVDQGASYDQLERLYYKALTDNTWKKAHPQRGFRKSGLHPLIYQVATNHQLMPGTTANAMLKVTAGIVATDGVVGSPGEFDHTGVPGTDNSVYDIPVQNDTTFFTPRLTSLGWMDTRNVLTVDKQMAGSSDTMSADEIAAESQSALQTLSQAQINYVELPKLYMGVILLSKLYKVAQYYRMIINHRFAFKDFRSISFMPECSDVPSYFDAHTDLFDADTFDPIDPLEGE